MSAKPQPPEAPADAVRPFRRLTASEPAIAPAQGRPAASVLVRQPAVSHGFAELYLNGATLIARAPACLFAYVLDREVRQPAAKAQATLR